REIRERVMLTLGGLYDPMTGRAIQENVDAFEKLTAEEYRTSHEVNALLDSAIVIRSVQFNRGEVSWDGVTDSVSGRSGFTDFITLGFNGLVGIVPALSFVVRLTDAKGLIMYSNAGGLQLLGNARYGIRANLLATMHQQQIDPSYVM